MSEQHWRIEQPCPQCGAPVELHDSDRMLECAYCRIRLHIAPEGELRFCLPPLRPADDEVRWVPFWRLRGAVLTCVPFEVTTSLLDVTRLATPLPGLPPSLGVRPQALKLSFATRTVPGRFLQPELSTLDAATKAIDGVPTLDDRPVGHRAFLGQVASVVYFPVRTGRLLVDGIIDKRMAGTAEANRVAAADIDHASRFGVRFLPTLCPYCGWGLEGERDSLVLLCRNCQSAWRARDGSFARVAFGFEQGGGGEARYLPFWRSRVQVEGLDLGSYADLARLANLPVVARPEWNERSISFWTPAFTASADQFLRIARTLTLSQPDVTTLPAIPLAPVTAVTAPPETTAAAFTALVAGFAAPRDHVFGLLPSVRIVPVGHQLVYLPFRETPRELLRDIPPVCIPKAVK